MTTPPLPPLDVAETLESLDELCVGLASLAYSHPHHEGHYERAVKLRRALAAALPALQSRVADLTDELKSRTHERNEVASLAANTMKTVVELQQENRALRHVQESGDAPVAWGIFDEVGSKESVYHTRDNAEHYCEKWNGESRQGERYHVEPLYRARMTIQDGAILSLDTTPSADTRRKLSIKEAGEIAVAGLERAERIRAEFPASSPTPSTIEPPNTVDEWCDHCDGCGWNEGGVMLRTTCYKCGGSGRLPAAIPSPSETPNG